MEHTKHVASAPPTRGVDVSALDVLVILPAEPENQALVREVQRTRACVRQVWPFPNALPDGADLIMCDLSADLPGRLGWNPGEASAALVATIPHASLDLAALRRTAPDAILHRPFVREAILASLALAWSQFTYHRRLRSRIDKLDETLRAIRAVERAKAILVATRDMDETAAYGFLRSQAMQRRVSIGAIAAAIVDSHDLLG